jgi:hypothetical protein
MMLLPWRDGVSETESSTIASSMRRSDRLKEQADDYPHVVVTESKVRVIRCRDSIQWVVQHRRGARWDGRSFCRTRAALLECAERHGLSSTSLAVLAALPEVIEGQMETAARVGGAAVRQQLANGIDCGGSEQ